MINIFNTKDIIPSPAAARNIITTIPATNNNN
jgi:hypothetical protein